ncbi:hypothetical protein GCM10020216_094070 [Nonomuraea helvata]
MQYPHGCGRAASPTHTPARRGGSGSGCPGATADWLYHLKGDMCALRVIKDGIISVPVMIPANPDATLSYFVKL